MDRATPRGRGVLVRGGAIRVRDRREHRLSRTLVSAHGAAGRVGADEAQAPLPRGACPEGKTGGGPGCAWCRGSAGKAEERLPARVEAWHEAVGVAMPRVIIANQRKRLASWGRDGTMRLNWRLIQVPDWMVDYVVVRQLVRLRHPRQGRDFRQAFERVMPGWDFLGKALRREEPGLFW